MTPARGRTLPLVALLVAALGWLVLDLWTGQGNENPPVPWTVVLGTAALAFAVLVAGWEVRRTVRGRSLRPVHPLSAARAAVLAKAAAYGGAALTGWYVAQALVLLPEPVGARRTRLLVACAAALAAAGLAVAGLVAQRWCRVPPRDEDDPDPGATGDGPPDPHGGVEGPGRPDAGAYRSAGSAGPLADAALDAGAGIIRRRAPWTASGVRVPA